MGMPRQQRRHRHEVPNVKYRYTVIDNRTVVVDPETRKVIKIIQ